MLNALLDRKERLAELTRPEDEDVAVEVTNFFGGGERKRGEILAVAACPKCLNDIDKGVTRAYAE